ncbi:MAG: hypothetical protein FD162_1486 [Rhodobacteraceae bacterium]|uniref:AAA+ family ATPase n=1 Tax=Cypionkella sp. TaxID=2811411 RepID=UPI0013236149|nr:AAA+ family ATPase [Cypionkella sp.]KAF0173752.1 MAG: hypothetical protein FD162_1486 [Paracoccaceae bacterium]MDO8328134.1 AAA+ family ATPase [Cypionkella sp.]
MKHVFLALLLLTAPALAQTEPPANPPPAEDLEQGLSLMEQGAQMLLRHMMGKVEPSLQEMTEALKQAQPQLLKLLAMVDDIRNFHAPEVLENGDILIRRKTPAELRLEELQGGETEL